MFYSSKERSGVLPVVVYFWFGNILHPAERMNEWMNEQMNEWTNETKQTETRKVANSNSIPTFKKLYFTLLLFLQFITIIISMIIIIWSN